MDRNERIGLRVSIAMQVVLVLALEPSHHGHSKDRAPEPQRAQVQQVDLEVLKTQFARQEGTIPDRRDNDAPSPVENGCVAAASREPLPEPVIRFDIPEAPLDEALSRFSQTLNVTWAIPSHLLAGRRSLAVHGFYTPTDAANRLLAGTGLCKNWVAGGLVVTRCDAPAKRIAAQKQDQPSFGIDQPSADECNDEPIAPERPVSFPVLRLVGA